MRTNINEFKKEMITEPSDFSTSYDIGMENWGFAPFGVHRDSYLLDRSNWDKITEDLMNEFPDSFEIMHCNHWAVGWMDHLMCKMTDEKAIERVIEIYEALQDYCIYDESDYSEKECEAEQEYIDEYIFPEIIKKIENAPWEYYNITGIETEDEYDELDSEPSWYYDLPDSTKDLIKTIVCDHVEDCGNDEFTLYNESSMWEEIAKIKIDFPEKGIYNIEDPNQKILDLDDIKSILTEHAEEQN